MTTKMDRIDRQIMMNAAAIIAESAMKSDTDTVQNVADRINATGSYMEICVGLRQGETGVYYATPTPEIVALAQHYYDTDFRDAF